MRREAANAAASAAANAAESVAASGTDAFMTGVKADAAEHRGRSGARRGSRESVPRPLDDLQHSSPKESAWLLSQLREAAIHVKHTWQAHQDAITSLTYIRHPPAVFTTSADRMACVWKHDGSECYGSLRRGGGVGSKARRADAAATGDASHSDARDDTPPSASAGAGTGTGTGTSGDSVSTFLTEGGGDAAVDSAGEAGGDREDDASVVTDVRAREQKEWRFPHDAGGAHAQKKATATSIMRTVESETFVTRNSGLQTPTPSEAGDGQWGSSEALLGDDTASRYRPPATTELCNRAWLRSRSPEHLRLRTTRPATSELRPALANVAATNGGEDVAMVADELCCALYLNYSRALAQNDAGADDDGTIGIGELGNAIGALGFYPSAEELQMLFSIIDVRPLLPASLVEP